jgi:hypothetical protein
MESYKKFTLGLRRVTSSDRFISASIIRYVYMEIQEQRYWQRDPILKTKGTCGIAQKYLKVKNKYPLQQGTG